MVPKHIPFPFVYLWIFKALVKITRIKGNERANYKYIAYYVIQFIQNSRKCKLIYSNKSRSVVAMGRTWREETWAWGNCHGDARKFKRYLKLWQCLNSSSYRLGPYLPVWTVVHFLTCSYLNCMFSVMPWASLTFSSLATWAIYEP